MPPSSAEFVRRARAAGVAIPAFNIPYLPMMEPTIRAVVDCDSLAFVEVARPEWTKFEAGGPGPVKAEYDKYKNLDHVRLHLDHVPVIDEDLEEVDYLAIIDEALDLGYDSVMVDGSRLSLDDNIAATRAVVEKAHARGVPCEGELGAVMGHEDGPLPPYEELFASGQGFTDIEEARRFVQETRCDWLSVAFGSIHGAISLAARDEKKLQARLNLEHLARLYEATGVPLVLHGGSGIKKDNVLDSMKLGVAKINVGTETRQAYEVRLRETGSVAAAQEAVYERATWYLREGVELAGTASLLRPREAAR